MSYIGNTPAENYASFLTQTFSVTATASYTLDHAVSNENDIRLVINNVVQQPGSGKAYTASGTTLTLSEATASTDVMYCVYLGRALQTVNPPNASVGTSQLADGAVTSNKLSGVTQGITQADVWRYTASTQQPSGLLNSNFERADDASSGTIGSAMTFSSGTWSFPITGIYLINASVGFNFANQADNNANLVIGITNNNSSYDDVAIIFSGSNSGSGFSRFSQYGHAIVDVTDTAQVKIQITANSFESDSYLEGSTDRNDTAFSFIRLGDT